MAAIKPIDQSSKKWVRRASEAVPDYIAGVQAPRKSWEEGANNAKENYKKGVIDAANAGRFEAGVKRVGDAKWKSRTLAKGPARYPEGVSIAEDEWKAGFSPYQEAMNTLNLPKRGPRRSAANLQRVAAVSKTFGDLFERIKKA